jgi:CO/xanthine dehydrogenase Mo-binding subunit
MTGLLHEKQFSRQTFLKGSGALIVGFSLAGAGLADKAQAAIDPFASNSPTALDQVDSFIVIHADNTASILTGGSEHGQGSATGWLMLAGEELDMDISQLKFVWADTNVTPINVSTVASQGTKIIGPQVRAAAAYAKQALLGLASASLGVPVANLTVRSGVVSGGGKSVTYGELLGDKLFNVKIPGAPATASQAVSASAQMLQGVAPLKPVSQYKVVGTRVPRIDIPDIVTVKAVFNNDIRVPGMLHGRIVLPHGQAAYGFGAPVLSVDESSIKHIPNVQVVRKGDFVGVVAPHEYHAIQAAAQLKVTWADPPEISGDGNLWSKMRADDAAGLAPARYMKNIGNVEAGLASAAIKMSRSYSYQYRGHMPIGPGCCVADVTPDGALLMTQTQDVAGRRAAVAAILGLPVNRVRIKTYPGSSFYGDTSGRIAHEAAAVMSQIVGRPVRVQLMRWDEHGWDGYGPAQLTDIRGGMDANGNIVALDYTSFAPQWTSSIRTMQQLVMHAAPAGQGSDQEDSSSGQQYNIPNRRNTAKSMPLLGGYFQTSKLRSTTQPQHFPLDVFVDELAYAAKMDPIAFRRQNVSQAATHRDRALAVLDALAQAANWQPRVAASNLSNDTVVTGRGIAVTPRKEPPQVTFMGAIAEIEVNKKTGKIVVKHIYGAIEPGLVVNPMGIENQLVGQAVMAASMTFEEVRFNTKRVTGLDWVTYPILRFKDHPSVTPIVINRPEFPMTGIGDFLGTVIPPAIANAFFDATGVRIRQVPMTPAVVRAVLKAGGSGVAGVA